LLSFVSTIRGQDQLRVESFADARNLELMDAIAEIVGELNTSENHGGAELVGDALATFSNAARKANRAARKAKLKV